MASDIDFNTRAAADIAKAKAYYQDKKLSKAAATFEQVTSYCPCDVPFKKTSCLCKSLVPAITSRTLDAELRKKCICSAKSDVRCKHATHIDALDGLAAVQEAKGRIDLALIIAEAMINLAPREPKGFLRLGKLLRLKASYDTAYEVYQQGIELVSKKNPSHQLLPVLCKVRDKTRYSASAKDPLAVLPLELVAMIFKHLDLRCLCRCLRVSKSWKKLLTTGDKSIQFLWCIQHFGYCRKPIPFSLLHNYAIYSGSRVKELAADRTVWTDSIKWLRFVMSAPQYRSLKVLKLVGLENQADVTTPSGLTELVNLCIAFEDARLTREVPLFVNHIVYSSAKSLREISFRNVPMTLPLPVLENLRILRIYADAWSAVDIDLAHVTQATPNVEQVWIDRANIRLPSEVACAPWSRLKCLFLGRGVIWGPDDQRLFQLSSEIEELHVMNATSSATFLDSIEVEDTDDRPPFKLRKFTLRGFPSSVRGYIKSWEGWVQPGLESGSLQSLEAGFYMNYSSDWLRSDQLRFLSFEGFKIPGLANPYEVEHAFLEYLERFPNLEAIDISEQRISDAALAKAIQKGIKTIYYRDAYHQREELRKWALEKYNAQFIYGDYINMLPINTEASSAFERPCQLTA
ncbi:hypothetical protein F4861DRAFT_322453 [Xylaria intraflava]|nr:hypothetical protein F4861DRAFT_322453 [Xylaria intraflava]